MDFKIAVRSLRRNPGFTVSAVAILALGIGANAAIFSVVHGVILQPLGYRDSDRIVSISTAFKNHGQYAQVSGPDFVDFRDQSSVFESMAVYDADVISVATKENAEFTGVAEVSPDFFQTIGIQPSEGRRFTASDQGRAQVALVSDGFWRRHFGNQPIASGHEVRLANLSLEIIGILPGGFHFPEQSATDVWIPMADNLREVSRSANNYRAIGRLKTGVSVQQAQAQLSAIAERLAKAYPDSNKDKGVFVTLLVNFTVRRVRTGLYVLFGAVVLVLLIACANIANLLLARGTSRIRELAIRAALGAGRSQLIRQLFAESVLLAVGGCLGGVLLAKAGLPTLLALAPSNVPRLDQVQIDVSVLLFCLAAAVAATFIFGLGPTLQMSRTDPNEALRFGGSRGALGSATGRLREAFVIAEVALCTVLLVSAGLLLKSFAAMVSVELGFRPESLLVAEVSVSSSGERANETLFKPLLARLSESPRVEAAAITGTLPGQSEGRSDGEYIITGQTMNDMRAGGPEAGFSVVSSSYFQALGIPLIAGRAFSERDDLKGSPVAIISKSLARQSFAHKDPLGEKILCGMDMNSMKWMRIVGVVGDVRMDSPTQPPTAEIYMPYLQHPRADWNVIVKARAHPLSLSETFRADVRKLAPEASVKVTTMENHLASVVSTPRFSSILTSAFAALALILAMMGIYGVMAYSVIQQTAEIGIRIALGADRGAVLRMVLQRALKLTSIGLIAGCAGAIAATRILKSQLFGISATDPSTYALVLILLAAVSILASYIPAFRASRTEPLTALRQE